MKHHNFFEDIAKRLLVEFGYDADVRDTLGLVFGSVVSVPFLLLLVNVPDRVALVRTLKAMEKRLPGEMLVGTISIVGLARVEFYDVFERFDDRSISYVQYNLSLQQISRRIVDQLSASISHILDECEPSSGSPGRGKALVMRAREFADDVARRAIYRSATHALSTASAFLSLLGKMPKPQRRQP